MDENNEVIGWIGCTTDIHEEREKQMKLQEERQIREHFVATLTHDLRTPLTAAKMSAHLLFKKSHDEVQVQRLALRIQNNIERVDLMIRDLLDVGRVKAGEKIPLNFEECSLNQVVNDALMHLSTIHGDRFIFKANKEVIGYWSVSGLTRVIENLCDNAVKYGGPNSNIEVTLVSLDQIVSISVHNYGRPISSSEQAKLFDEGGDLDSH